MNGNEESVYTFCSLRGNDRILLNPVITTQRTKSITRLFIAIHLMEFLPKLKLTKTDLADHILSGFAGRFIRSPGISVSISFILLNYLVNLR